MATPLSTLLLLLSSFFTAVLSQSPVLQGILLDCGASSASEIDGLSWIPDDPYTSYGVSKNLPISGLLPILSTLRSFPFKASDIPCKFCYAIPVVRNATYLVRATYFYGGPGSPPVFDLIVDGTFWTVVNTTGDYANRLSSYYEGVFRARGKRLSVCLGVNVYTESDPFISALEVILLENSVYNATDFSKNAMGLIARSNFGSTGPTIGYPDDNFRRFWQPVAGIMNSTSSNQTISASGFWNLPPENVLRTALLADPDKTMELQWPPVSLSSSSYYIALYFADPLFSSSRTFSVYINENNFINNLEVTSSGLMVFSSIWNLSGFTKITLLPRSTLPPLINAAEIFGLFPVKGLTIPKDVIALESIKKSILNPPTNWIGDPCLPREYSWTGVTCSEGGKIRIISLNLSSMGLSGTLSPSIGNLTALTNISFADNNLTGPIPELNRLKLLENLHLQDNQFIGEIPPSFSNLKSLRELFLQNNNLTGVVPKSLKLKDGLILQLSPGNNFTQTP
ncbi:putative leucine-rich repeat receptor-like serine/threonine-protein kinase At2g14440 [Dioscorea cayenensis subsp. rotundata]|uniref:Leucine-rich repeat receptor-like serine/threonine-protein kinase At2g14440 n=1 Tax=Dioscorea cayennensis subsp. rotundata TaxID=55577 RepID=A0AB40C9T0_DIOCR|nr:putative leucine-rich repeat receptor-like serine/threonine-protein kinase At2g14440 [Dioscorea cayenensis subsp. rotundata]